MLKHHKNTIKIYWLDNKNARIRALKENNTDIVKEIINMLFKNPLKDFELYAILKFNRLSRKNFFKEVYLSNKINFPRTIDNQKNLLRNNGVPPIITNMLWNKLGDVAFGTSLNKIRGELTKTKTTISTPE